MDVPVARDVDVDVDDGSGDNDESVVIKDPETSEKGATAAEVEQVPKNVPDDTPTVSQIEESSIEPASPTEIEGKEGDVVAPTSKEVQNEKVAENNRGTKEPMIQKKVDSDESIMNNPNDVSDAVAKEVISVDQSEQKEVHSELLIKKTVTNDEEALNEAQVYSDVALSPPRKVPTIVSSSYSSSKDEDNDDKEDEESSSGEEDSSSEEDDSSSEEEISVDRKQTSMTMEEKTAIQQKARLTMQQKAKVGTKLTSTAVAKGGAVFSTEKDHNRSASATINNLRLLERRRSDDDESSSEEEESSSEDEESDDEESSSSSEEEESSSEEEISRSKGQNRRPLPKQSGVAKAPLTETTNYLNPISSMFSWSSTAAKPEVLSTPKPAATASPKRSPKKEGVYMNPVSAMFGWTSSTTKPPTVVPPPRKSARAASAVPLKPAPQSKEEDESSSESESSYESGEEEDDSSDESEEDSNNYYKVRTNIPNRKGQAKSPRMEDILKSLPDGARKSYANSDKAIQHDSVRSRGAALLALAETIPNRPHSPVTVLRRSKAGTKSQSPNAASATTSVHPSAAFQQMHNEMIKLGTDGLEQSHEHMAHEEKDSSDSDDESSEEGSTEESSSEEDSEESSEEEDDKKEEAKSSAAALFRRQSAEAAAAKAAKRDNRKKPGVKNVARARSNQTSNNGKATHDQQEKSWLVGATDWLAEKRKERQELELKREKEKQIKILRQAIRKKKKYSIKAEQQELRLLKKWEQNEKQQKQEEEKKKQSKKNLKQTLLESESESESESSSEEEDSSSDEASSSSSDEDEEDDESEEESDDSEGEHDTEKVIPDVQIQAEPKDFPFMLGKDMMNEIAANFPETVKFCRWKRLYSVAQHQHSFDAMFRSTLDNQNTLVIVRSKKNHVFGGFVNCAWETANNGNFTGPGGGQFYGTDEAFLFRIESSSDEETKDRKNNLVVFKSTGKNRYIQLCDILQKKICMGGEEGGRFGLCLEDDFKHGSTVSCDTFGNKPLTPEGQFQIEDVEIWGFESSAS